MEDKSYQFQIIDFSSDDIPLNENEYGKSFVITIYGKTKENENIVCNIVGFKPYFYLRIPDNWGNPKIHSFLKIISYYARNNKSGNSWSSWNGTYERDLLTKSRSYNFYGFNYDKLVNKIKKFNFAKISFQNHNDMRKCSSSIQSFFTTNLSHISNGEYIRGYTNKNPVFNKIDQHLKAWFLQEHNCDCIANLYESKIHPMLRFMHEKKIDTCGWVEVKVTDPNNLNPNESKKFNVDIEIDTLPMKYIKSISIDQIASFITASFDIECDSSHGDFPNPNKDFKKLAIDIHESYFRNSFNFEVHGYDFKIKRIKQMIRDAFQDGSNDVQNIFTINGPYSKESFESIIQSFTPEFILKLDSSKANTKTRDTMINDLTKIFNSFKNDNNELILIQGDPIIQIGTVFHKYGDKTCYDRSIIVIGNKDKPKEDICDDIKGINIYRCQSEKELLLKWKDLMLFHNPDIVTGYNIFGFDFDYINKRIDFLFPHHRNCKVNKGGYHKCDIKCPKYEFYRLGRLMRNRNSDIISEMNDNVNPVKVTSKEYNYYWEKKCQVVKKELSSSGLGDNILNYISMDGRIIFDIQKEIQKSHSLDSYKLDNVSAHFMKGTLDIYFRKENDYTIIKTNNTGNLKEKDYILINLNTKYGQLKYENGRKFQVIGVNPKTKLIKLEGRLSFQKYKKDIISKEWCLSKDDVSPQELFRLHKHGGSEGRAKIAKYCIMDCELCIHLLLLLDLIPNNIGMANVSSVPLSYIFLRGQGIKIFSLVVKKCSELNTRIPTLKNFNETNKNDDGFEGAIVLDPEPGIYLDDPVSVLDYASLYPNSIIEKNLSHETFICTKNEIDQNPDNYQWLEKIPHHIISYDDYIYQQKGKTIHKLKADSQTTCYFAKPKGEIGIIPTILKTLLDQRKKTRALIKETNNEDKKKVLDGLQLAYKVTANSVYGQMGAKTSSIFFKKIAACTTSIGRERIYDAELGVKEWALDKGFKIPHVVYGDTDSVFVKFSREKKNENGQWITLQGKEALQYCIDCGIQAGKWITEKKFRKNGPQDLEYEKTFYPFILISKKRYTGDKYEYSADKLKERTSMGIVMKRRDNAPIVKYVFGNVIEIIMNQKSINLAMDWLKDTLQKIKDGKMDDSMFIISKSLSAYYKNPDGIAHKALADRMAERNPGNKPKPNDRIPFMYRILPPEMIYDFNNPYKSGLRKGQPREKKILQGDRIEHPDYIKEKNIDIDYSFYISNQIMNPVKQVLDLEKEEEETKKLFGPFI